MATLHKRFAATASDGVAMYAFTFLSCAVPEAASE
jgi:hypothetical protein